MLLIYTETIYECKEVYSILNIYNQLLLYK